MSGGKKAEELTGITEEGDQSGARGETPWNQEFEDARSEQEELLSVQQQHPGQTHTPTYTHTLPGEGQCLVPPVEDEEALSPSGSSQLVQHSGPDLPHL